MSSSSQQLLCLSRSLCDVDPLGDFLELMQLLMGAQYAGLNPAALVKEAAQGHTDNVRRILAQHPTQVCSQLLKLC